MKMLDVVIVGSGFGGSVMACRLAESGRHRVRVLERGRRYGRGEFPRSPADRGRLIWDPAEGQHGLMELSRFKRAGMDVVTASGLGGGSLIYSNVLYRMPPSFFKGWPGGIDRARLDPFYDRVIDTLEARPYPLDEPGWPYADTPKARLLARAAEVMGRDAAGQVATKLERPALAVTFGPGPTLERRNKHGALQTTCSMCGQCNLGCDTHSKNTLDLTYLRRAQALGARIDTHAEVQRIAPRPGGGFTVAFGDPRAPGSAEEIRCDRVIVAAGSLGSTRLLLRQKRLGHLPGLSGQLGRRWSPNGDMLAVYFTRDLPVDASVGPVITGAVRFLYGAYPDGSPHEVLVEDGGFPDFLAWHVAARPLARNAFPLLAMGRDRSTGVLALGPGERGALTLDWDVRENGLHFERAREAMARLGEAVGAGTLVENPFSLLSRHITVHPLGGCPMGASPEDGVVDARTGQAFGHPGLYVIDGSIVPGAIGPNPALTIAALAEYYAEAFR